MHAQYLLSLPLHPANPMDVLANQQSRVAMVMESLATDDETVKSSLISSLQNANVECGVYLQQGLTNGAVVTLVWNPSAPQQVACRVIPGAKSQVWLQWGLLGAGLVVGMVVAWLLPESLGAFRLVIGLLGGVALSIVGLLVNAKRPPNAHSKRMMDRVHAALTVHLQDYRPSTTA